MLLFILTHDRQETIIKHCDDWSIGCWWVVVWAFVQSTHAKPAVWNVSASLAGASGPTESWR